MVYTDTLRRAIPQFPQNPHSTVDFQILAENGLYEDCFSTGSLCNMVCIDLFRDGVCIKND